MARAREIVEGDMYVGYSNDVSIRSRASSGGIVSAVLIDLIERGIIDGALVSRISSSAGRIIGHTERAKNREDVLTCAGSSYIDTPVIRAITELSGYTGKVAVVGLPCQVRAIRRLIPKRPDLGEKIAVIIGLFCRGTVRREFYEDLFTMYRIDPAEVDAVRVVRGHIKGDVTVSMRSGETRIIPFGTMNSYRIAGIHSVKRCLTCEEHLSREADIAVGDIFTAEYKERSIKHSSFVCWSRIGKDLMQDMEKRNIFTAEHFGLDKYLKTFARIERFGNRMSPRVLAARLTGMKLEQYKATISNPFHNLAWTIIFINSRMSRTHRGRKFLYSLPPTVISLEALTIKALSRL